MQLLDLLNAPPREFTPIPFWFLNGDLSQEEIRRQLWDFCEHGVYGVVLHPRIGLPERIGYLSDIFFAFIRTAVETAAELNMKVVLYDEGMYPSGSANGQVVAGHPELASLGLALADAVRQDDLVLAETGSGTLVVRKSGGTIRGIHFGEDDGEPHAPPSADILNPEAVERFLQLTHEAYYRKLAGYFGSTVIGFFTDEPSVLGRNVKDMFPWTRGFEQVFAQAGGVPENLAALFSGEENQDTRLYRRLILERENEVYYGALSRWCEEHGVALMGHPHQSDDIEVERYFHIPGQDLVLRWVAPEKGGLEGIDSTMGKCSADAARLLGRRRNSNECFGACNRDGNPWQFSGGDMKWYLDWLAVREVNLFIPHAFYYSIEGKRREERPPDVGPNNIWWPHYRQWALYMSRLSCLMTDGSLCAPVAVPCRNRDLKPAEVRPLFEGQIGFQYLPESVWSECREEDHTLVCGGRTYRAVLGEDGLFPGVPRFEACDAFGASDALRDCVCTPPHPQLRTARFERAGQMCWLLVNEGEDALAGDITLPTDCPVGQYDLWTGAASRVEAARTAQGRTLRLALPRRGSLLLFACSQGDWEKLPAPADEYRLPAADFQESGHDPAEVRRSYEARLAVTAGQLAHGSLVLELEAEEMAELYVNGVFAGVGFWPPQRFELKPFLREGENTLHLVVTGSLANRYGDRAVPYGCSRDPRQGS